jgi:hypothetical protein
MHRLPSKGRVRRFRFVAILLVSRLLLIPATLVSLVCAILIQDRQSSYLALGIAGFSLITVILLWAISGRTNCPLCMTPVLAHKRCSKHRRARKLLGSYRMRAAAGILVKNSFLCPYCNEPTVMEVRDRTQSSRRYSRG